MYRSGFTLIEVLVVLFILTTGIFGLSELQVRSVLRVWDAREDIDRIYRLKKHLYKKMLNQKKVTNRVRSYDDPDMKIIVEQNALSKKSSLAQFMKEVCFVQADAEWMRGTSDRSLRLVTLLPTAPPQGSQ